MLYDPLLQPLTIKHVTFRNRIMSTSHADGHPNKGQLTESLQRYHVEKARGGIGLTMFGGSSNVSADSADMFGQLNFSQDAIIPYLQQFSRRVHNHGAALMAQITHMGRRGSSYQDHWLPTVAPSRLRETVHRSIPKEMDAHDIERIIREYGEAALRCKEGGLDGLETITPAHLTGQFLSPMTNRRTDQYGGSLENRLRLIREVYAEMRRRVGDEFLLGIRYGIDEKSHGWLTAEEALKAAQILESDGIIDFFNLMVGRLDTELTLSEQCMPGMEQPLAPFLEDVAQFRAETKLPIFHATRIVHIETARQAVRDGILDLVGMTRAHIADPHLVNKIKQGQEKRVRPCVGAQFCQANRPTTCIHNPATSREAKLPHVIAPAETKRKVVIVGGGVAGLEAARVSAERGHAVVLIEAADNVGGQVNRAAKVAARRPLQDIVTWRKNELAHLGVEVRLNTRADVALITAENPDVVLIATGGTPYLGEFDGIEQCASTWDALQNVAQYANQRVIYYDNLSQHQAPSVAAHLALHGANVTFVTIDGQMAEQMGYATRVVHRKRFTRLGIPIHVDLQLTKVEAKDGVLHATFVNELTGMRDTFAAEHVIVEQGTKPSAELYHTLRDASSNDGVTDIDALLQGQPQPNRGSAATQFELHRIGDAVSSRSIHAAIYDALRLCMAL